MSNGKSNSAGVMGTSIEAECKYEDDEVSM